MFSKLKEWIWPSQSEGQGSCCSSFKVHHECLWIQWMFVLSHWRSSSLNTSYFIYAYLVNVHYIILLFTSPQVMLFCQVKKKKKTVLSWCGAQLVDACIFLFGAELTLVLSCNGAKLMWRSVEAALSWGSAQLLALSWGSAQLLALSWTALTWQGTQLADIWSSQLKMPIHIRSCFIINKSSTVTHG